MFEGSLNINFVVWFWQMSDCFQQKKRRYLCFNICASIEREIDYI